MTGMEIVEKGVTHRHTFFCVDRERHGGRGVIEAVPKRITVYGETVEG